jgi:hypothetical protein
VGLDDPLEESSFELHVFADASTAAFDAVVYMRTIVKDKISKSFFLVKGLLAPLQTMRIPLPELQAAVMAVRLASKLKDELRLPVTQIRF